MKRTKKHKIKHEVPETSGSFARDLHEHDLAYYIHDRVELMHQVFSVLKARDLKALAPECVRKISIDDLQELCTEELLGISSKRLCAILDGAEPPSDTESSSRSPSPVNMETISLDSISSDEEILGQAGSKKKKHKHRRRDSKSKSKHRGKKSSESAADTQETETCRASRAGLTVLELLELQARARAIRAQLQQEQAAKLLTAPAGRLESGSAHTTDNEVEIKEEAPEVVEISSEDEKPSLQELQKAIPSSTSKEAVRSNEESSTSKETDKTKKSKSKKKDKKCKKKNIEERKLKSKDIEANAKYLTADNVDEEKEKGLPMKEVERNRKDSSTSKETCSNITESSMSKNTEAAKERTQTVTRRSNDLIITVPQQPLRKIKLNRSKVTVSVANVPIAESPRVVAISSAATKIAEIGKVVKPKEKIKKKLKRREKRKSIDKEGSDHDEITLQLSDSEKMDLLEDFDRKHYDNVSSSSSEDSESSSDSDSDSTQDSTKNKSDQTHYVTKYIQYNVYKDDGEVNGENSEQAAETDSLIIVNNVNELPISNTVASEPIKESKPSDSNVVALSNNSNIENDDNIFKNNNMALLEIVEHSTQETFTQPFTENYIDANIKKAEGLEQYSKISTEIPKSTEKTIDVIDIGDIPLQEDAEIESQDLSNEGPTVTETSENKVVQRNVESKNEDKEKNTVHCEVTKRTEEESQANNAAESEELSEGQLTDRESSEVEVLDLQPEVVCLSDDQQQNNTIKKKKKKEKKSKKEKKAKKSKSDFRESADQNFYRDISPNGEVKDFNDSKDINHKDSDFITLDYDDDVYEFLELSDDSSCYEVEGTVLSKEPTAEEIEALSAKIDEIERVEVITDQEIIEYERLEAEKQKSKESEENLENISWKDRYLGSKKVKRVLTTSNILNALRKKNKELKKKIEESKNKETEEIETEKELPVENKKLEEGSIGHYNTLLASTKYVDPVPEPTLQEDKEKGENLENVELKNSSEDTSKPLTSITEIEDKNIEVHITGEMKKDAKQLLKMYKKLLKYNDMNKQKDPNKKKKKKKKKEKDGASAANVEVTNSL